MTDRYARAACKGVGTEPFFPSTTGTHHRLTVLSTIKQYCTRCPVRDECAEAGESEFGVWGGNRPKAADKVPRRVAY